VMIFFGQKNMGPTVAAKGGGREGFCFLG
jgi:hypothetical protein